MKISLRDIVILVLLVCIDFYTFYYCESYINLLFKPLFAGFLVWKLYQHSAKPIGRKNKLVIISLAVMLFGEFLFLFRENQMISVIIMLIYLIEHQMYISIFREENARLTNLFNKKNFLISLPLILTCFFYFGSLMMPNIPDNFLLLGIIYCVQLSLLAGLAVARETTKVSYKLVIISMILLILSDSATSYTLFVEAFYSDYAVIRGLFLLSKVLFVLGMCYSSDFTNHLDKEYT
ncbi:YhhN-like protein [Spirosomataceae bacterium TFI 002]|nr:YhhN-like protein [Spirosomataceae bacterium TFI 002]